MIKTFKERSQVEMLIDLVTAFDKVDQIVRALQEKEKYIVDYNRRFWLPSDHCPREWELTYVWNKSYARHKLIPLLTERRELVEKIAEHISHSIE